MAPTSSRMNTATLPKERSFSVRCCFSPPLAPPRERNERAMPPMRFRRILNRVKKAPTIMAPMATFLMEPA